MPRSLRAWLASLALIAFPGLAQAQTFLGPPHLAPVALEARCPLVGGLGGAVTHFLALGADPLQVALMKADAAATGGVAAAEAAGKEAERHAGDHDLRESLARLAATEPVDVAARAGREGHGESDSALVGCSPVIVELDEEYLPYDLRGSDLPRLRLLPFSTPRSCSLTSRPAAPAPAQAQAQAADSLADNHGVCHELAACYAIVKLEPPASPASDTVAAAEQDAVMNLVELIPSREQWDAAARWISAQRPPMPLHCWLDEAIGQASDVLDSEGPLRRELSAERMGARIALGGLHAGRSLADAAEPVMPILARVPAAPVVPAAAPAKRPGTLEAAPLSLAAGALHSAAGQLEYLAASLRELGTSVDRVARARLAAPATLRR